MSLKAFHLVFIVFSTGICAAFALWCAVDFASTGDAGTLAMGLVSLACAIAMIPYSRWFLRKLKNVGYL